MTGPLELDAWDGGSRYLYVSPDGQQARVVDDTTREVSAVANAQSVYARGGWEQPPAKHPDHTSLIAEAEREEEI